MWLEYATWSSERNIRAMSGRKSFVIIGGGASGVLLAAHLLHSGDPALRVTVVERTGAFGRGLAYSATLDDHVLNVGAHAMSAFADEPDHFRRWLARNGVPLAPDALFFAPRRLYGDYLGAIAGDLAAREPARLRLLHAEAVSLSPDEAGVSVGLADGATLEADAAILAAGHDDTPASLVPHAVRPGSAADAPLPPDAPVMILGTGLSMVDAWLELKARGHRGPVTALSRRGLLPRPHLPRRPKPLQGLDVPLGLPSSRLLHWLRGLVRRHAAAGGEWQDVVDGLRPFNQRIWRAWSPDSRQRFLRHAKTWWDVHRHRVAPHIHARLAAAVEAGELRLVAGRVGEVEEAGGGFAVEVLPRHAAVEERIVQRVRPQMESVEALSYHADTQGGYPQMVSSRRVATPSASDRTDCNDLLESDQRQAVACIGSLEASHASTLFQAARGAIEVHRLGATGLALEALPVVAIAPFGRGAPRSASRSGRSRAPDVGDAGRRGRVGVDVDGRAALVPTSAPQYVFDARIGRYRETSTGRFVAARNLPWPDSAGFASSTRQTVSPGTILDRYGSETGRFLGTPGATISQRGMAQGSEAMPYTQYRVLKPLEARVGPAAPVPAFGASGGSTQYLPDRTIEQLVQDGFLERVVR